MIEIKGRPMSQSILYLKRNTPKLYKQIQVYFQMSRSTYSSPNTKFIVNKYNQFTNVWPEYPKVDTIPATYQFPERF